MSFQINGIGDPVHLRELVRRHLHHYDQHLAEDERLLVNHLIGHGLRHMPAGVLYQMAVSGHEDTRHYDVRLTLDRIESTELPPPVPDDESPQLAGDAAQEHRLAAEEI